MIGKPAQRRYPDPMTSRTLLLASLALTLPAPLLAQPSPAAIATAREAATTDTVALDFVRDITTEVGPRQGGTEAEARARDWAIARLTAMGFANVRSEPFTMPTWVRGEERASIIAPFPQALAITALGNSGATPAAGMEGEVVGFRSLAEFEAAPASAISGKIVYIGHAMRRTQDGSSYGAFGPVRFVGPDRAARRGAAAIVIRSVGTDSHRNPHTGNTNFGESVTPIPAGAISNPDADNLERMFDRARTPVRMRLLLTPRNLGPQQSGNVIAEIVGTDPSAGIVVAACHLDSWDLGTGAIDDAAGCGIIAAAAKRVEAMGRPRRTIRLLMAGAEEVGIWGGAAYGAAHAGENHAAALESDFGAGRVWRVDFKLPDSAAAVRNRIAAGLAPLSIARGSTVAGGGADIGALAEAGVPLVDLQQDGSDYFDLHHTPDDTFDKIVPADLAQNVAAWTVTLAELANAPEVLGRVSQ
jgi:carboxypeptidase Q